MVPVEDLKFPSTDLKITNEIRFSSEDFDNYSEFQKENSRKISLLNELLDENDEIDNFSENNFTNSSSELKQGGNDKNTSDKLKKLPIIL